MPTAKQRTNKISVGVVFLCPKIIEKKHDVFQTPHEVVHIFYTKKSTWEFPKIGVPQNGWFIKDNPI